MNEHRTNGFDPIPTVTLAKLYEQQGFLDKAASVYRKLLLVEPGRADLEEAVASIERRLEGVTPLTKKI